MNIKKVLVANRGEIAIRIFRACTELRIETVGVYTYEDRYSLHRYKADESYQIGADDEPIEPYLNIDEIIEVALEHDVDAIHPGYGFLSENADFAEACGNAGILFIGPQISVLKALGDKMTAKAVAKENDVPTIESNIIELHTLEDALYEANRIGYPLMLKAASGRGGRGMRVLHNEEDLRNSYTESKREAQNAFGDDTVFLEKYIANPKHIEIQILGDQYGNIVHLYERDCSVQRRYQKVIEYAPAVSLDRSIKEKLYKYALKICSAVNYQNAGTVEFLVDEDGSIYFIEVNPRIQVEHTVTEVVTGVDLVKAQIFVAGGYKLSDTQIKIESQDSISISGVAIQCRITTEDPVNDFKPDYGTISTYRSASGFGVRLDAGSVYQGVKISPFFDSLLVKVSAHSRTLDGACRKMRRALAEFRVRGVKTNISFLDNILIHPLFRSGDTTVNFIKDNHQLLDLVRPRNRATKLVEFLGHITINGHPDVPPGTSKSSIVQPEIPRRNEQEHTSGTKQILENGGPQAIIEWIQNEKGILYTDTTMRDAHQYLIATRMRTYDMMHVAENYTKDHPNIFSMEVWGGATYDVCLRFLKEDPWERLQLLHKAMPNVLLQMLLRGSNAVGYTAYPDNLIERFIIETADAGIDIFRIFDSLNWMESLAPCIEKVRNHTKSIAEASLCYTGDILNMKNQKYNLNYYIQLAKDLENAGAHILAIKDMAGLLKPDAAFELVSALKSEVNLPIHLHTHDTSSLQAATYMRAIDAGVDIIDVALGGLSGPTSQPNFNALVEMMKYHDRNRPMDTASLSQYSQYWEAVRSCYFPFESGLKSGTADVYKHEIPGGQYSNLKSQVNSLGLGNRFHEITNMYAQVDKLFGEIIKVTPSSKVVGDMAQFLVNNKIEIEEFFDKADDLNFPSSVISFFKGELGQPVGGFPKIVQKAILKNEEAFTDRPNAHLDPLDIEEEFKQFQLDFDTQMGYDLTIRDFLSYKLYPKVYKQYYEHFLKYGRLLPIPTQSFFFGMQIGDEVTIEMAKGKTLLVSLSSIGEVNDMGEIPLFFKVNGQMRVVLIRDLNAYSKIEAREKANSADPNQLGAPLQVSISNIFVESGDKVKQNAPLYVIEAMKMETTITAHHKAIIDRVVLEEKALLETNDLLLTLK